MKRQRTEIMAQILAFCTQARRKTRIMYRNYLSHSQLKTYLTLLTSRDLLAHNSDQYVTTEKGHCFLEAFAQLNDVLEGRTRRAFE
ncbi:MAG: winged helix-turn-helix domain-containing protein [Candidatus Bathyarchaeota archaeon]|nr:winged helix-turn-helix domain-containing protein [Candidatus Bathyarchaeota archaeon]MDH5747397.1 winged helix-turn-helix domain-containing protein [Candidatus Bathyarchaeota archaeon]